MKTFTMIAVSLLLFTLIVHAAPSAAPVVIGAMPALALPDNPTANDLSRKYATLFDSARVGTEKTTAARIRSEIERDFKRFTPVAETKLASPKGGAANEVRAAKVIVKWLSGPLTAHLAKLEAAAG